MADFVLNALMSFSIKNSQEKMCLCLYLKNFVKVVNSTNAWL